MSDTETDTEKSYNENTDSDYDSDSDFENVSEDTPDYIREEGNNFETIDVILEKEYTLKDKIIMTLNTLDVLLKSDILIHLMSDDIPKLEYNRSYNYYSESSTKLSKREIRENNIRYRKNLIEYQNKFKILTNNVIKIIDEYKEKKDLLYILKLYNILSTMNTNLINNATDYVRSGYQNCLHGFYYKNISKIISILSTKVIESNYNEILTKLDDI